MTRLLVLSDLHLEHRPVWSLLEQFPLFDVAVVAGDVDGSPERAVHRLATAPGLAGRPIVYVPGNHEYYHGGLKERLAAGRAACAGTSVRLLDRHTVEIAGVRFVGATLWTDYKLFGDPAVAMAACQNGINDHRLIQAGPPGARRLFRPEDAAAIHAGDRAYIEAELARPIAGPTVVVTHHAPHPGSVAPRYVRDLATPAFVSDLEATILRGRPALWVHGHVHHACNYRVGATRVLANPKGYGPKRRGDAPENAAFDPALIVEVPGSDHGADGMRVAAPPPQAFRLVSWVVLRLHDGGHRHLLGYRVETLRGRTTSPIMSYERATRTATTSSGNRYQLIGPPSEAGLDDPVVLHWLAAHDLSRRDVEIVGEDEL